MIINKPFEYILLCQVKKNFYLKPNLPVVVFSESEG